MTDGQTFIQYLGRENDNTENMFTLLNDNAKLYYRQETKSYEVSLTPKIEVIKDQSIGQDDIFSQFTLQISDVQGIDHIMINDQRYQLNNENKLIMSSQDDQWSFDEGENTIEVYDQTMAHTSYHFIYDTTAPDITYTIKNQQITIAGNEAIIIKQDGWKKIDDLTWSKQIDNEQVLDFSVYDLAGNQTRLHISIPSVNVSDNQSQQTTNSIKTGDHSPILLSTITALFSILTIFCLKKKILMEKNKSCLISTK